MTFFIKTEELVMNMWIKVALEVTVVAVTKVLDEIGGMK
ncbi:hypothetical protein predicted by Glimmer/Critica [Lactiplantibacillus plantarum]|nr:hypothetical protein SF2A35B_1458 [Lactiplantibacillus plantarum]CDN28474.1 hypothetical protein predicted by Glimmer/Critica [Lactiplantibacillus plantarum]